MSVEGLKRKECGPKYEESAAYFCEHSFGPLEVAYDHSLLVAADPKRRPQAGSHGLWRYSDFLPTSG